jgi:hypothetical protein
VVQRTRLEQQTARSRGPVARLLLSLTVAAGLLAAATMFYGVYRFPDAPIRETASGYVGKGQRPRTQADFEAFLVWERTLLIIFPTVFVFGFASAAADKMLRRKRLP